MRKRSGKRAGQSALVEDFIDGREFHVSVWNNDLPEVLPPAEMDFSAFTEVRDRLCTYDSKCRPGKHDHYENLKLLFPGRLVLKINLCRCFVPLLKRQNSQNLLRFQ